MDLSHPRLIDLYSSLGHTIHSIHHRLLLSEVDTNGHDSSPTNGHISSTQCEGHTEDHDIEEAFQHIYFVMLFMAFLWFIGKVFARCGLPSLVGEIVCGIILGPNLLNFVPYSDALIVIGEIGLVLLVLEAGIDVSIGHLKVVGFRGCVVAVSGSMLPLGIGTGLAMGYGQPLISAFAIGACLAPTSMGIALNVLRNAKVLNTPTGQLIIAAAVLDDVIALMLLSELEAMADPTIAKILLPLVVSPAFIVFFGFLAIKVTPWLIQKIMIKTNKHQHENVILLLLFTATFTLIPICFYAGSSHLLGAFLAGLMFCTDHTIHEAWSNQIKRIMQWMLRIFFACTIGFAVPIQDFWSKPVIIGGLLYFVAIIGKLFTGIFAKPFSKAEFFTIAFSMSAWGEFAFILATASYSTGAIDKESYSSVLMAVLLSVVISPLLLRTTLSLVRKNKMKKLTGARDAHYEFQDGMSADMDDINIHPVYFCVHTKGRGRWGHQDKLLHCIFNLKLEIIDFRAYNEAEYNYSHHIPIVQDVFYVRDQTLSLPPTKRLGKVDERKLQHRYKELKRNLKETMGDPHASIDVMRWLPGVKRTDDIQSPVKGSVQYNANKAKEKKKRKTASYCRKEAYKQARLALDHVEQARSSSYLVSGISRIRPSHDAVHRDKFTYHGGIHTEQDDLIAMAFIDTLQSIQASLSPENRASPTGSTKHEPLSHDELFAKINTLRNCVEHLQVFQPALSDDGHGNKLSNPPSMHSMNGDHVLNLTQPRSFAQHYATTFMPLQQPNISAESTDGNINNNNGEEGNMNMNNMNMNSNNNNGAEFKPLQRAHTDIIEHGSILGIVHDKPASFNTFGKSSSTHTHIAPNVNVFNLNNSNNNKNSNSLMNVPPQPGLFVSHSHGLLPSAISKSNHNHPHHSHFNHLPRDVYPRDNYAHHGHGHHTYHGHHSHFNHVSSQTHSISSDHQHHTLHPSSTEEGSASDKDDLHCDTMYGDEDEHHRPLNLYGNLDDLDEEPLEYELDEKADERSEERSVRVHKLSKNNKHTLLTQSMINLRKHKKSEDTDEKSDASSKQKSSGIKRSTTWSKINIFKHLKISDDDDDMDDDESHESDGNNGKKKRNRKKKRNKKSKDKKLKTVVKTELSTSSIRNSKMSWEDDEFDTIINIDANNMNQNAYGDAKMLEIPQSMINKTHIKNNEIKPLKIHNISDESAIDDIDSNETQPLKSNNDD